MPTYSDDYIRDRVSSGKDKNRARTADQLAARARAGDQAALQELVGLSRDKGGWATNDAVNYGRMLLRDLGYDMNQLDAGGGFVEARDGGGFLGSLGGILKTIAPAAALIPGVGIPLAAGIGAAGNLAGNAMQGNKLSLGGALGSAALGAGGAALLGGQGINGIGGIGGRLGLGGGAAGGAGGAAGAAGQAAGAAGGGGGGFLPGLGKAFGLIKPDGGFDALKALGLGGAVAGGIAAHGQAKKANAAMDQARGMALDAYQRRQPISQGANAALLRAMGGLGQQFQPSASSASTLARQRMEQLGARPMPSGTGPMAAISRAMM
jgi:hypothetical protein